MFYLEKMFNSLRKSFNIGTSLLLVICLLTGCAFSFPAAETKVEETTPVVETVVEKEEMEKENDKGREIKEAVKLQNDFTGAKVEEDALIQGCFGGKDCIPSIDDPVFETAEVGEDWLEDDDRIFGLNYKGEVRAYPQRVMNWHEIVNDVVAGDNVIVTFCPLCGSAVAFVPEVNGTITEFGVSGKLHNNDLVMYDRWEGNLWQQITGEAIVGPAAQRGEILTEVPLATATWKEWKEAHPKTKVLSRETGHIRDYSRYPYGTYEADDSLLFGVPEENTELQIKEPVYGIEIGDQAKAYQVSYVEEQKVLTDTVGEVELEIKLADSGELFVTRKDTGERVPHLRVFWFAWAAFHPETQLSKRE